MSLTRETARADRPYEGRQPPGLELALSRGGLKLHESGAFVSLTQSGADVFA
jgi:hypothetical protein